MSTMRDAVAEACVGEAGRTGEPLAAGWWAPALALAERHPPPPDRTTATPCPDTVAADPVADRARRRLHAWRDAHGPGDHGRFTARLADLGLTEDEVVALLGEPPAAVAARTGPPSWARFTDDVLARGRVSAPRAGVHDPTAAAHRTATAPPATGSADGWTRSFAEILAPYVDEAAERLVRGGGAAASAADVDLTAVRAGFTHGLTDRLVRVAARTLVLDLNIMRSDGRLVGDSAEQRFADFVRRSRTPAALRAMLTEYPVLARLLAQICEYAVDATVETLVRFAADRAAIVATLLGGTDPGRLIALDAGAGDTHQRGRTVALLRFASGARAVYKPRTLSVHQRFNEVVEWLNARMPDLRLRTLLVLARPTYGWVEFVHAAPCADRAEVDRFYHRQGVLLALLHALDAADVHYENLIACGDQPVLVDVETLFHPPMSPPGTAGVDPAGAALDSSVYRIALLPRPLFGDHGALDISGMGGDKGSVLPVPVAAWDASATDEMRLVRRAGVFAGADNRPRLDGADADPTLFADALLAGFRAGYDTIVANRPDLVDPDDGILHRFADADVRVVVRATRGYVTLLDESTHPDVMRDAFDRDRLFDVLWAASVGDPMRLRLVRHETAELWQGDVPMFTARPGGRELWTGTGERIADVLDATPLDRALDGVRTMSDVDRYDQEWVIRATLATRRPHDGHETGDPARRGFVTTVPEPYRLLAAARGVADQIIARGFDDGDRINWLGLELLDERHWTIMPLGAGLATGYSGTAMFLAQLTALTGDTRYAGVARRALYPLPRLIDHLSSTPGAAEAVGCGGVAGFGGIAYSLAQVCVLLDDTRLAEWLEPVVQLAAAAVDADRDHDVVGGSAGCLVAMLAVHDATGLASAWDTAVRCAERLAARPVDPAAPPGFAFGAAGVGWALLRFAAAGGDPRYATRGMAYLHRVADVDHGGGHSWCGGGPGVGLALLDAVDVTAVPWARAVVDRAVATIVDGGPLPNHSLCHGELGRLELLGVASRTGHATAVAHGRHASMLLAAIERSGPRCGTPGEAASPGLLTGLAGIGHGLLRLGFPESVPSVMLLQPPRRPRTPRQSPHQTDGGMHR